MPAPAAIASVASRRRPKANQSSCLARRCGLPRDFVARNDGSMGLRP